MTHSVCAGCNIFLVLVCRETEELHPDDDSEKKNEYAKKQSITNGTKRLEFYADWCTLDTRAKKAKVAKMVIKRSFKTEKLRSRRGVDNQSKMDSRPPCFAQAKIGPENDLN
jgi:hypothetical protein